MAVLFSIECCAVDQLCWVVLCCFGLFWAVAVESRGAWSTNDGRWIMEPSVVLKGKRAEGIEVRRGQYWPTTIGSVAGVIGCVRTG